ncbi:polyadenylate-binding protein-interacting protein 11-like [Musa acuminata AAA Group]|uniref:polyadenylate-binding protein-interacting protein 11-like n=1 Tax=Musa acuminata AAA Group TaxID=214697 RepID=UPI0031D99ACC
MCSRTVYCTNIDKKVSQADLKLFFESICGEAYRVRVLGDCQHSTRIAFVEFVMAESATAALNCSGVVLGSMPLRIKPLKDSPPRAPGFTSVSHVL